MRTRTSCFAVRRCARWIGVARVGSDEHQTIAGFDTRAQAVQAAREVAVRLNDSQLGMAWWNALHAYERALWLMRAGSARPVDAWHLYRSTALRPAVKEVRAQE